YHASSPGAKADKQIRDDALSLLLAGYETTAFLLTWTCYLLSRHQDAAQRLHEESRTVLGRRPPTAEDLPRLVIARMILDESMRLFPPAWLLSRRVASEDTLDGHRIAAGTNVLISPYVTQRHPSLWKKPERFLPDRFAPGTPPP